LRRFQARRWREKDYAFAAALVRERLIDLDTIADRVNTVSAHPSSSSKYATGSLVTTADGLTDGVTHWGDTETFCAVLASKAASSGQRAQAR
jgi:hypothetical protein